jgi:hypothetical protein
VGGRSLMMLTALCMVHKSRARKVGFKKGYLVVRLQAGAMTGYRGSMRSGLNASKTLISKQTSGPSRSI